MALLRYALIACLIGLSVPACTQDEDEACQVNSDCADGLTCLIDNSLRGTCVPPGQEFPDSGTGGDGDETVDEDVAIPDAGAGDAAADDDAG